MEKELAMRGVNSITACRLVRNYAEELVREKIANYDQLQAKKDPRISKNPAGYLVQSIRHNYQIDSRQSPLAPPSASPSNFLNSKIAKNSPLASNVIKSPTPAERKKILQIEKFLDGLTVAEQVRIEAEALTKASETLVKGYWRTREGNNPKAFNDYRQLILRKHVAGILRQQ
jgi:hypothetical protein